jgi:hypothetical protein
MTEFVSRRGTVIPLLYRCESPSRKGAMHFDCGTGL